MGDQRGIGVQELQVAKRASDQTARGLPDAAYRDAFFRSPVPMAITALDGRVLSVNEAFRTRLEQLSDGPRSDGQSADGRSEDGQSEDGRSTADVVPVFLPVPVSPEASSAHVVLEADVSGDVHLLHRPDGEAGWWLLDLESASHGDRLRDPLTGLADRRLLLERVSLALSRRRAAEHLVEMVVLDLDEFKAVNDQYGHVVGDQVLLEVAARLSHCVRPADLVARWGGDEFVVLLEEGDELGGHLVCGRVEQAFSLPVQVDVGPLMLQLSCGWVRAEPGDDAVALLHRADVEMYRVKAAHRRRRRTESGGSKLDDGLRARLARARVRAEELRAVTTDAHARTQLVLSAVARRREAVQPDG